MNAPTPPLPAMKTKLDLKEDSTPGKVASEMRKTDSPIPPLIGTDVTENWP